MSQSNVINYIATIVEEAHNIFDSINAQHQKIGQRSIYIQHDYSRSGVCYITIMYLFASMPTRSLTETIIKNQANYKWDIQEDFGNLGLVTQIRKEVPIEEKEQFLLLGVRDFLAQKHPEWNMSMVEPNDNTNCMEFYAQKWE